MDKREKKMWDSIFYLCMEKGNKTVPEAATVANESIVEMREAPKNIKRKRKRKKTKRL